MLLVLFFIERGEFRSSSSSEGSLGRAMTQYGATRPGVSATGVAKPRRIWSPAPLVVAAAALIWALLFVAAAVIHAWLA